MRTGRMVLACALALLAVGAMGAPAGANRGRSSEAGNSVGSLDLYYTPPVLVRSGERVTLPVDVICATRKGLPCSADVVLGLREPGQGWRMIEAASVRQVRFDLSASAVRAHHFGGAVSFFLRARAGERTVSLPRDGAASPLQFFVTGPMPVVHSPFLRYGDFRRPSTVLFLPWGSGPMRAGLSFGHEAPTSGPSAFDVDRQGRVYLLDPGQNRLAAFDRRSLARTVRMRIHPSAVMAVGAGRISVMDRVDGSVRLRTVFSSGRTGASLELGPGIPSEVRTVGKEILAHVLPLDAWVRVSHGRPSGISVGRPFRAGAQLLRVARETSVRLGTVFGGAVRSAVELRSHERFGEVALAEPDRRGGYVVVVRVWRQQPSLADQFQAIHLGRSGRVLETFAIPSGESADTAPMGRFRLGPHGDLYEMRSASDGVRIVRFDLRGEGR